MFGLCFCCNSYFAKPYLPFTLQRKTSATTKDAKNNSESHTKKEKSSQSGRIGSGKTQGVKRSRAGGNTGPIAKIAVGKGVRHQLNGYLRNPSMPNTSHPIGTYEQQQDTDPTSLAKSAVGKGVAHHYSLNNTGTCDVSPSTANAIRGNNLDGFKQHGTNGNNFTFLDPSQLGMDIDNSLSELQSNYQSSLNGSDNSGGNGGTGAECKSSLRRDSSLVALAMIPSLQSIEPTPVAELGPIDDEKAMMTFIDFPNTGEQLGLDLEPSEIQKHSGSS